MDDACYYIMEHYKPEAGFIPRIREPFDDVYGVQEDRKSEPPPITTRTDLNFLCGITSVGLFFFQPTFF